MEARYRARVALAEHDYAPSAARRAQTVTMWGAFIGVGLVTCLLVVGAVVAWAIHHSALHSRPIATAMACAAAVRSVRARA